MKKVMAALSLFASLLGSGNALACADLSGTYLIPSGGAWGNFEGQRLVIEQKGCEEVQMKTLKLQGQDRSRVKLLLDVSIDGKSKESACELAGKECELTQKASWEEEESVLAAMIKQVSKDDRWIDKTTYRYDMSLNPSGTLRVRYRYEWNQRKRRGFPMPERKAKDVEEFEFRRLSR